jgi:hypothetical protein
MFCLILIPKNEDKRALSLPLWGMLGKPGRGATNTPAFFLMNGQEFFLFIGAAGFGS